MIGRLTETRGVRLDLSHIYHYLATNFFVLFYTVWSASLQWCCLGLESLVLALVPSEALVNSCSLQGLAEPHAAMPRLPLAKQEIARQYQGRN